MGDPRTNGIARFKDQVALVVGGAHGIGKALGVRLGREGAHVAIADIDCPTLESTVGEMCSAGLDARPLLCDVRESGQVQAMVKQAVDWRGRIDVMMYVAGIAPAVPFLEITDETWDNTVDINLRGAFLVSKAVAPHMVARKRGKLVFMASTNCWDAEASLGHYNASKAGVFLLAKTLARELGPYGINSNALGPGFIKTRLTEPVLNDPEFMKKYDPARGLIPLGRLGTPEDVVGPALFLASDDASYVNGVLLFVDGGQLA
ncbi:MAG TPA: SDR family oxidoreductase [Bryobacteraceae bacterium]|nr:SDR family oxidoreductase [Bryobacteraceae bacterium]HXJ38621.1 SDR family oxidoreductase [Bryobacteraceae bacterium]